MRYIYLKTKDGKSVGRYKSAPEGCEDMIPATRSEYEEAIALAKAKQDSWRSQNPKH